MRKLEISGFNKKLIAAAVGFGLTVNFKLSRNNTRVEFFEPNPGNLDKDKPDNTTRQPFQWIEEKTSLVAADVETVLDALALRILKHIDESKVSASWCKVPLECNHHFLSRFNESMLQMSIEFGAVVNITMSPGEGPHGECNAVAKVTVDFLSADTKLFSDKISESGTTIDKATDEIARKVIKRLNSIHAVNKKKKLKTV